MILLAGMNKDPIFGFEINPMNDNSENLYKLTACVEILERNQQDLERYHD
jgi:hypothetical protein